MVLVKEEREKEHSSNTITYPISLHLLGLLIVSVNLGSFIEFSQIKPSYFFAIACLISLFIEVKRIVFNNDKIRNVAILLLLWVCWGLFQFFISKSIAYFMKFYMILLINVFICLLMLLFIKKRSDFNLIMRYTSIAFVINILGAIFEFFSGVIIIPDARQNYYGLSVVAGFIGNYNDFCTFLFLAVIFFLIMFFIERKKVAKIFYLTCIVLSILFIFYNGSRGGIYSIYVFALSFIFILIIRKTIKNEKSETIFIIFVCIIVGIIAYLIISKIGFDNALSSLGDIGSDKARVSFIQKGYEAFVDSYFLGVGAGATLQIIGSNLHCFYLEILFEYGIFFGGFAIYLSFIVFLKRNSKIPMSVDLIISAAGIALIVANFTSSSSNKMRMMWIFITIVFLIKNSSFIEDEKEKLFVEGGK